MSDRELLELAFKAADLKATWIGVNDQKISYLERAGLLIEDDLPPKPFDPPHSFGRWWNPLADDGDALRLAVKLELHTSISGTKAIADWWRRPAMIDRDNEVVPVGDDPCAALRRAIVRAAAEIGKAMP